MKIVKYLALLLVVLIFLLTCSFDNLLDNPLGISVIRLPDDRVNDTPRSYSGSFEYETLLPVSLRLNVELYKSNPGAKGSDSLTSLPSEEGIVIAKLEDSKGNPVYAGRVQPDGTLDAMLALPAAPEDMVLILQAPGFQERMVTIPNMVQYSEINRTMSMLSEGITAKGKILSDSDGDLVPDVYDAYPSDPDVAFTVRIPDEESLTVAYEDLYLRERAGDADYNDFLARYYLEEDYNGQNELAKLRGIASAEVKIAGYNHKFGMVIDYQGTADLTVKYFKDSNTSGLPLKIVTRNGVQDKAIIELFESTKDCIGRTTTFTLEFTPSPLDRELIAQAPYDPYLYVYDTTYDIHLIGKDPLPNSNNPAGSTFQDEQGFPWALLVPIDWQHPAETQFIEELYPRFQDWRLSEGTDYSNWYLLPKDLNNNPPYPVTGPTQNPVYEANSMETQYYELSIEAQNNQWDPDGDPVFFRSSPLPSYMSLDPDEGLVEIIEAPPGQVTVYFWSEDERGADTTAAPYKVIFIFELQEAKLESIVVNPEDSSIFLVDTQQFTATGNYTDGSMKDLTAFVTWSSSNTSVATIDANGLATSQGIGTTTIKAVFDSVEGSTFLTVSTYNPEIGTWTSTTSFSEARYYHSSAAYNGYLYVVGGWDGDILSSDLVRYAPISSDGSVGSWQNTIPVSRSHHAGFSYNGRIYLVGGTDGITILRDVLNSTINTDGTLGTWGDAGGDLNTVREWHSGVEYKGYIYVTGGSSLGWDYLDSVEYAPINGNGTVGSWDNTAPVLTTARYYHASVAYRDYLYVVGGLSSGGALGDVIRIPINDDGSLGSSWEEAKTNPTDTLFRYGHTCVVNVGYLYVIGGFDNLGTRQNTVVYAPIDVNGEIGAWVTASNSFSTARGYHSSSVYNGKLYVLGGNTPSPLADVQYAPFSP